MPLIQCPDCGHKISDQAPACVQCGRPSAASSGQPLKLDNKSPSSHDAHELLLEAHPSQWNYFWDHLFFFLIIPPILASLRRSASVLRVYTNRVVLQKGVFSREIKEVFCSDVRSIEIRQSFFQRLANIGDVVIGNAASDSEEVARGVPDPTGIKDLILSLKKTAPR